MSEKKKFLYTSTVSTAMQYSGILRKVAGQTAGMARLGWDCRLHLRGGKLSAQTEWQHRTEVSLPRLCQMVGPTGTACQKIGDILKEDPCDLIYIKDFSQIRTTQCLPKPRKQRTLPARLCSRLPLSLLGGIQALFPGGPQAKKSSLVSRAWTRGGPACFHDHDLFPVCRCGCHIWRTDGPSVADSGNECGQRCGCGGNSSAEDRAPATASICSALWEHLWCMATSECLMAWPPIKGRKVRCLSFSVLWEIMKPSRH